MPIGIDCIAILAALFLPAGVCAATEPSANEALGDAKQALQQGRFAAAKELATKAIATDPNRSEAFFVRGRVHARDRNHEAAIADFSAGLKLDPQAVDAYNQRGSERLLAGQFADAIADFDKYLAAKPEQTPFHWQRGIAYYYAGRYDEGRKQFEEHQTVNDNDVENAVWRYLCIARGEGLKQARESLLKIKNDRRVPLMKVHALFSGQAQPDDVLAAAKEGNPAEQELKTRMFYAHLYLGLYFEAAGNRPLAKEHMTLAAEKYKVDQYMWDVAKVHAELLAKEN